MPVAKLADQPSDDQHHGLIRNVIIRDSSGSLVKLRMPSQVRQPDARDRTMAAVPSAQLPVGDISESSRRGDKPVRPEGVDDDSEGQEKNEKATPSLGTHVAQDRKGAVRDRLEFHARIPRSTAVSLQPGNALCRLMPIVVELGSTSHNRSVCLRAPAL